jgi:hypothetical protein
MAIDQFHLTLARGQPDEHHVEAGPVGRSWAVTSQRMRIEPLRQ